MMPTAETGTNRAATAKARYRVRKPLLASGSWLLTSPGGVEAL
jgi:hypothetical protein